MPRENVEVVLRQIEAVNRQDANAFVATASPNIEWEDAMFWSEPARIHRGRTELREWFRRAIVEPWEGIHFEVEEINEAADDRVLVGGLLTARGRGSGVMTEEPWLAGLVDPQTEK
jgi:ketosteroid isomerase-like protein